jgi:hypothetical protein
MLTLSTCVPLQVSSVDPHLQDAMGALMSSYDYHMDGDKAEVGGAHAMQRATRTLIVCFDRGAVNFQVCLLCWFVCVGI